MITRFSEVEVDWSAMEIRRGGEIVPARPRSLQLLEYLFSNRDRVVTKDELFEHVWQRRFVSDSALTSSLNDLRRAIGDTGSEHRMIRTYYGQGLRFIAEVLQDQGHPQDSSATSASGTDAAAHPTGPVRSEPDQNTKVNVSIAILALDTHSSDPALDSLGEAIAEALTSSLSRFAQLSVVSRTSAFSFRHETLPLQEISRALGVDYVVEGSLRDIENNARVTLQIIDAAGDEHVWAGHFDWQLEGTLEEEDAMLGVMTGQLIEQITRYEGLRAKSVPDADLTAWHCYYRGVSAVYSHKLAARNDAIRFFERAVELNPNFALARALMSFALNAPNLIQDGGRLRSVDPDRVEADLARAEQEALRSLEQDPRFGYAWASLGRTYNSLGRPDEGIGATQTALELNPFLPSARYVMVMCHWSSGDLEDVLAASDTCIELGPSSVFHWMAMSAKAYALAALERYEEAVHCSRQAQARSAASVYSFFGEICALGYLGRQDAAADVIQHAKRINAGFDAALFGHLYPTINDDLRDRMNTGFRLAGLE